MRVIAVNAAICWEYSSTPEEPVERPPYIKHAWETLQTFSSDLLISNRPETYFMQVPKRRCGCLAMLNRLSCSLALMWQKCQLHKTQVPLRFSIFSATYWTIYDLNEINVLLFPFKKPCSWSWEEQKLHFQSLLSLLQVDTLINCASYAVLYNSRKYYL